MGIPDEMLGAILLSSTEDLAVPAATQIMGFRQTALRALSHAASCS